MPMPIEVVLTTEKDKKEVYYIPLRIMRGEKPNEWSKDVDYNLMEDWPWTHPTYRLKLNCKLDKIKKVEINPAINFIDLDRSNNTWPKEEKEEKETSIHLCNYSIILIPLFLLSYNVGNHQFCDLYNDLLSQTY